MAYAIRSDDPSALERVIRPEEVARNSFTSSALVYRAPRDQDVVDGGGEGVSMRQ